MTMQFLPLIKDTNKKLKINYYKKWYFHSHDCEHIAIAVVLGGLLGGVIF